MAPRFGSIDTPTLGRTIRRVVITALALIAVLWVGCATTTRVDAGHVGVKVKLTGNARGVQPEPLTAGWHLYNPATEQIVLFPTSVQNVVWTQSAHEGSPNDDSITFSSKEGANVNADIGLSFHIEPSLAPKLYDRFRLTDMRVLANGYMRNTVREAFNDVASKMPIDDVYGVKKTQLLGEVTQKCRDVLSKDGIVIDQLTVNGALRLPQLVADAINRQIEATQQAIQSENRVRQVKAEAEQNITQAHGQAEAARQKAQGDGDALLIRAKAEAQANEIIRLSMTPAIMQYRALERWNGQLPTFQSSDKMPLLTFEVGKLEAMDEATRQKRLKELLEVKPAAPPPAAPPVLNVPPVPAAPAAPVAPAPARPKGP